MRDFGVKWFPYLSKEPGMWFTQFIERDIRVIDAKDKKKMADVVINSAAALTVNRIGFQGTQNLEYLRELVMKGAQGSEEYRRYSENWIMNKVMGRPFTQKTADRKLPYNLPTALMQWLLKIQTPAENKVIATADKKEEKQVLKDISEIRRTWK